MFSSRLKAPHLIEFSRSLRFSLTSGLMVRDAVDLVAKRGARPLRPVAATIATDLRAGWNLQDAFEKQAHAFPPLFLALSGVGEETGNLPEVLGELEAYYELQLKLQNDFRSEIFWPVFQFIFATLIVAAMIYLVGILQPSATMPSVNSITLDPLGLGLIGFDGALKFLGIVYGSLALGWVVFSLLRIALRRRASVEWFLYRLPMLGPCLTALTLTRFCTALRLMLETNLSIRKTLRLALLASDDQLLINTIPTVETSLQRGNTITDSLAATRAFPENFIGVVAVAEECGRLPEALRQQAVQYDDFARRRLALLNKVLSWLIWSGIAVFIVFMIYQIFQNMYINNINRALPS